MAERPFETRTVTAQIELREETDAAPELSGYAATFDRSYPVGYFEERLEPSAFKRTLANNPDVRLLIDHEGQPLARTKSGTLQLSTDDHGLAVRATLDPTDPDVQRLLPKMRRGDLDQMSFAFRVPSGGEAWDYTGDIPQRSIREAVLHGGDVSVVTYPANEGTEAAVRALDELEAAYTLADAMLREIRSGTRFEPEPLEKLYDALAALGVDVRNQAFAGRVVRNIASPDEVRAQLATADVNDLPDSDFAYIEPGGEKDADGKTVPRSLRHFPIHDAAHVRNALSRAPQSPFGEKAMPAIKAAAKKFGIDVAEENSGYSLDHVNRILRARQLRRPA